MSSRSPNATDRGPIAVGRVLRAHGIRGEVKVEVWSDVDDRFAKGVELQIRPAPSGRVETRRVTGVRTDRGTLLLRFDGVESRDDAEALRGAVLEVDEAQVPEAPDGFYYHFQLEGCRVTDASAGVVGTVAEVIEDGGGHILRLEDGAKTVLIPFVDAFLRRVDVTAREIDVELPDGLIESCTSQR
ncbi:MAG: ribosome maturation factor RimM [Acidobacteriota bacterium]